MADKIRKHIRCIVIFSISALLTAIILLLMLYRPPLKNACIDDLKDIDGIGVYKAGAIAEFVTYNQDAEPEDLDVIDGIGEKTIEKVKEKYR